MEQDSGLLIAALVAIVAVVGLVILFKGGGAEGAVICPSDMVVGQDANGQISCMTMTQAAQNPLLGAEYPYATRRSNSGAGY